MGVLKLAFEVYIPRASSNNLVTLTKHHIRIGSNLLSQLNGEKTEIAYDRQSNKLRIKGTNESGMKIGNNKIGARGVFAYFGIDIKGSFPADFNDKENAIIVDLNKRR